MSPPAPKPERHQVSVTWKEGVIVPYRGYVWVEWESPQGLFVAITPGKKDLTAYNEVVDALIDDMYERYLRSDLVDTEE